MHHRLLQRLQRDDFNRTSVYATRLHAGILRGWLADHILHGRVVLPGAALVELACAAALLSSRRAVLGGSAVGRDGAAVCLEGFTIARPVVATDVRDGDATAATRLYCVVGDEGSVEVYGEDARGERVLHAEGGIRLQGSGSGLAGRSKEGESEPDWAALSRAAEQARGECLVEVDVERVYGAFAASGLPYGETFRLMQSGRAASDGRSCVTEMRLDAVRGLRGSFLVPPPLLDALLQASAVCLAGEGLRSASSELEAAASAAKVPFSFERVWLRAGVAPSLWQSEQCTAHIQVRSESADMTVFDCSLLSGAGEVVLRAEGVHARAIQRGAVQGNGEGEDASASADQAGEAGEAERFVPAVQLSSRWVVSEGAAAHGQSLAAAAAAPAT